MRILVLSTKEFYNFLCFRETRFMRLKGVTAVFFNLDHTNAESFNSKIKLFRANQRGVVAVKFFLFRMEKFFA